MIKIDYEGNHVFVFDKKMNHAIRWMIKLLIPIWDVYWYVLLVFARYKIHTSRKALTRSRKYKFVICAIFKNETLTLKEWVEYHRLIGVDHIYLYNNNSEDDYISILKPYIDDGYLTLTEWPIKPPSQVPAYKHYHSNFSQETQWCAFIDLDEFICMKECDDIKDYISKFENYHSVVVYWKQFGSNGQIEHDKTKLVTEQYVSCWDRYYDYGKPFFNFDFEITDFHNKYIHELPACIKIFNKKLLIPPINEFKKFVHFKCNRIGLFNHKNDFSIQINHYGTKSLVEFFETKKNRGDVAYTGEQAKRTLSVYSYIWYQRHCISTDYTIYRHLIELKLKIKKTNLTYLEN